MNLIEIEAFLAIVETGSVSKASEKLHLSQSSVSHRLKLLERNLDVQLIERNKGQRYILLTPKGEDFIPIAERWISLHKDTTAWQKIEQKQNLRIGCIDSFNGYIFPPLYQQFVKPTAPMNLTINTHWSNTVFNRLETHEVDIGFIMRNFHSKNIISEPLFEERMVVVSAPDMLTLPDLVHPRELNQANELFMYLGPEFQIWHDYWWDPAKASGSTVDIAILILTLLDSAELWSIVPISMARSFQKVKNIKISELSSPPPNRVCYKITHRNPSPSSASALILFDAHLKEFVQSETLESLLK
ncbi:LysR family transcriptional regulator [Acidaminobacter sp.]|uniref:LysR substrate-binding domain-containing protein n=1 Tax=Acidaminobacter sp. TaxID=1872102 RepID=UPI002560FCF4|nr:LysR family transcriptional regulator [Acidaminobacter sp.]MDK9711702.1 LysR family transcriptional regulator [Acidaminobacter sp.]